MLLDEERTRGYKFIVQKNLARWLIFLLIGVITAIIACVIDISIEELSSIKYYGLKKCIILFIYFYFYTKYNIYFYSYFS